MNYRFQKFTTIYFEFLQQFLYQNPGYGFLSYGELYDKFTNTLYGLSNYYAKHMEALGNEAQDIFASFEPLQKAWATENGVEYTEKHWLKEIVLAQIQAFQPDVLYLQDLYLFDQRFRQQLREACKKRVLLIGWRSAPVEDFSVFGDLDLLVTAAPHFIRQMQKHGIKAVLIPLAFEDTVLDVVNPTQRRDLSFTFIGTVGSSHGIHSERYSMMERLMGFTPLQVWSSVSESPLLQSYPGRFSNPVFGLKLYEVLARSKIGFNCHIDCAEDYAGNIRLYETTGMGACLITDWKINLHELFEPDVEVVTYRSAGECIEKVKYLLDHEDVRQSIATAGQKRTLKDHTYVQRVARLNELIIDELSRGSNKK